MSQPEPGTGSDNALANLGLNQDQSLALPTLNSIFSLEAIEAALAATGWSPEEHVMGLIEIARNAAKPVERMTAMRDLMKFIHETIEINKPKVVMTRKVEHVDEQGNRVTDTVEFTSRYTRNGQAAGRVTGAFEEGEDGAFGDPDD